MLEFKVAEKLVKKMKAIGIYDHLLSIKKKHGTFNTVIFKDNVAYVVKWREGRVFCKLVKELVEFDDVTEDAVQRNWNEILEMVMISFHGNQKYYLGT